MGVEDTFDSEKLVFFDSENHKAELMGGFGLTHLRCKGTICFQIRKWILNVIVTNETNETCYTVN